jgi:hypothetical protein
MTTRFAQERGGRQPPAVRMQACSHAVVRTRRHGSTTTLAEDAGARGHSGDWRAGMFPCRRASTAADKHSRRWRRDGSEGPLPATAGMQACSCAVVRTRRRGSSVGTALAEDGSARGSFPAVVGMRACSMPLCEHIGATAHSALAGDSVGAARHLRAIIAYTTRLTISRSDIYRT